MRIIHPFGTGLMNISLNAPIKSNVDKPWITPEIKQKILTRHKLHISKNFKARDHLNKSIKKMCFNLRTNYRNNNIHLLKNVGSKNWYRQISNIINPDS